MRFAQDIAKRKERRCRSWCCLSTKRSGLVFTTSGEPARSLANGGTVKLHVTNTFFDVIATKQHRRNCQTSQSDLNSFALGS